MNAAAANTMGERTTGLRAILSSAAVYDFLQDALGSTRARRILVADYLHPKPGQRVLDIGCGTADMVRFMPAVEYFGFDPNPAYVKTANERATSYSAHAHVFCDRVSTATVAQHGPFDLVMSIFVLHHLDDGEAQQLFRTAYDTLKPGGRIITADPAFAPGQSPIARFLLERDRGLHVRDEAGYRKLPGDVPFEGVSTAMRHDLLHVPYSHCIVTARKPLTS